MCRGASFGCRYNRNVVNSHSSGVTPGRARSTFIISPHTSTVALGKRLYCDSAHHRRGVEFRTVGAVAPRVLAAKERGDHVTNRMPVRDLRHRARFGVLRAHAAPLREYEGVPYLALGHCPAETRARYAVVLVRDALTTPDVLCRVNVVHRPEHLVMDALHVIRLREPVGATFQLHATGVRVVTRTRKSSRFAHAASSGTPSRYSSSGSASRSRLTNTSRPHTPTCTATSSSASSSSGPNHPRDGTSRSFPDRSHVQLWNGQRSSVRAPPAALAQRVAAMPAHVLERPQDPVVTTDDEHRDPSGAVLVPVARLGDVVDRARDLPHARPQPRLLELGKVA